MTTVSIVNVTSYTGLELLRLLSQHPQFVVTSVTARSAAGKRLADVFSQLTVAAASNIDPSLFITEEPEQTDLAFVCLPHAAAAEAVLKLLERGTKVVDLSADFRLRDACTLRGVVQTHRILRLLCWRQPCMDYVSVIVSVLS